MILYHGSNVAVRRPRLFVADRRTDFGTGFYLTSSFEQATRWARLVTKRRAEGRPTVSSFLFDESEAGNLRLQKFEGATVAWLKFVGANRRGDPVEPFDIVVGPVANDKTMPTLRLYFAGDYTEEEAIRRLLPQRLQDQYAFRTPAALDLLKPREVTVV